MSEQSLRKQVQLAASRLGARLFRVNTGGAWVGRVVSRPFPGGVLLEDARPIRMGLVNGGSDLIGWSPLGRFMAIELKTGQVPVTGEQISFLNSVIAAGGIADVVRSVEDVVEILREEADRVADAPSKTRSR